MANSLTLLHSKAAKNPQSLDGKFKYSLLLKGELKKGETHVKYSVVPFSSHGVYIHSTTYHFFILIFSYIFLEWLRSILQLPHFFQITHMPASSDPKEDCLRVACNHSHDKCCPSCDKLKSIMIKGNRVFIKILRVERRRPR